MSDLVGKKVYIAGSMRGKDDFNFPAFDEARDALAALGAIAISPTDIDRLFEGWGSVPPKDFEVTKADKIRFIRRDLECIFWCDAVYVLRGSEDSSGAKVEAALAEFLGLEVYRQA